MSLFGGSSEETKTATNRLNRYYKIFKKQILVHQSVTTGLFPCDLNDPNSTESHVRDSVYCAVAVWALSQAYKRVDNDEGRTHELGHSAVKCMRGILSCWIRQAAKLENFKKNQSPKYALHSRFHLVTGDSSGDDNEFEHLQIDCVALYLLYLVEMIQSGLQIIFTTDEVNFVQNLVFYVERAYRTPDFGMWERGSKYNNGSSELHSSSIGFSKAALEVVNGTNLYGRTGASWSVIFIDIDAHYRNRTTFWSCLPSESASKNTDSSLISTVGWPAFAVHDESLVNKTMNKVVDKLRGKYGFKRFLRDGYKTVMENKNSKYYNSSEIKNFDGIECEWPMMFAYMIIFGFYKNKPEIVKEYSSQLEPLLKYSKEGYPILPRYYYVASEDVELERQNPGSCTRLASPESENSNVHLWGQSVFLISQLLVEGFLNINELDPIRRYLPAAERPRPSSRYSSFQSSPANLVIQVVLISESISLQQSLATYGIQTQTPRQIEPIQIWQPSELVKAYEKLGINEKLGLSGRPARPIGGLGTAKIYRACGRTFLCYPLLFELSDFYLSQDMEMVMDDIKSDLDFLGKCWKLAGRPTFCMLIREDNLKGNNASYLFELLTQFKKGDCDGIKVRMGRLQEFISSACIEHLDFLSVDEYLDEKSSSTVLKEMDYGQQFKSLTDISKNTSSAPRVKEAWTNIHRLQACGDEEVVSIFLQSENIYERVQCLQVLMLKVGRFYQINGQTIEKHLELLTRSAGSIQAWSVVRFCASLLGKVVDSLAPSITAILVRGKQVTIGVYGHDEVVIDKPMSPTEIQSLLYSRCFPHDVTQAVLQQEILINIGKFLSTHPTLFDGILKLRMGWIVHALKLELEAVSQAEAMENTDYDAPTSLYNMSPSATKKLLLNVLIKNSPEEDYRSVIWNRQLDGALNRVPPAFYDKVWQILERTPGGIKVAGYLLPQQPTQSDMTQFELNFSLLVEQMLSKIVDPAYRQIIVESFMVVSVILDRNKELSFTQPVNMDKLVHEAFTLYQKDQCELTGAEKSDDMTPFYNTPPNVRHGTTSYIARAIVSNLLEGQVSITDNEMCTLS